VSGVVGGSIGKILGDGTAIELTRLRFEVEIKKNKKS
jgi:hypothetical protein